MSDAQLRNAREDSSYEASIVLDRGCLSRLSLPDSFITAILSVWIGDSAASD